MEAIVLKKMSNKDFVAWMGRNAACPAARKWVGTMTLQSSWKRCSNPKWMWFFLYHLAYDGENNRKLQAAIWELDGKTCAVYRKHVMFE